MTAFDPAMLTLVGSCAGALLFFGAGYYWNARPRHMDDDAEDYLNPGGFAAANPVQMAPAFSAPRPSTPAVETAVPRRLAPAGQGTTQARGGRGGSLRATLEGLAGDLGAQSTMILDDEGLPFTSDPDPAGAGARLSAMVAADREDTAFSRFGAVSLLQMGSLRLHRLDPENGPKAWLATIGAERFAGPQEIRLTALALAREVGL